MIFSEKLCFFVFLLPLQFDADAVFVNQKGKILPNEQQERFQNILDKVSNGPLKNNSLPDEPLGKWSERTFWKHDFKDDDKLVAAQVLDWQHRF